MIANVRGGSSQAGHQRVSEWQLLGGDAPAGHLRSIFSFMMLLLPLLLVHELCVPANVKNEVSIP